MQTEPSPGRWIAAVVVVAAGVHLAMALCTELTPDEAYYASWAFGWARGVDHPPLVGWLIGLSTGLTGSRAEWSVRLPAVVCSAASAGALALTGARTGLRGGWLTTLVVLAQLDVLAAAGGFLMTPDAPLVLAWCALLWVVAGPELPVRRELAWLAGAVAFGMLAKVSMLLALPVLAIRSPSVGGRRALLRLGAAVLGAAVVSPWWAAPLGFQLARAGAGGAGAVLPGGVAGELGAVLGAQVGLLGPPVFFFGLIGILRAWRSGARALAAAALVPLLAALGAATVTHVEANWAAPAHPGWLLLATLALRDRAERHGTRRAAVATIALAAAVFLAVHVLALAGAPWRPDPTARLRGWRAWARGDARRATAPDPAFPTYGLEAERRYYRSR